MDCYGCFECYALGEFRWLLDVILKRERVPACESCGNLMIYKGISLSEHSISSNDEFWEGQTCGHGTIHHKNNWIMKNVFYIVLNRYIHVFRPYLGLISIPLLSVGFMTLVTDDMQ